MPDRPTRSFSFSTAFGWITLTGTAGGAVTRLELGKTAADGDVAPCPWQVILGERIAAFLAGATRDDFGDVRIDWEAVRGRGGGRVTPFRVAVWTACRGIAPGERGTYAELATRAGFAGAARAVGAAMAANAIPLIVPCHRVVRSDGHLGGFSAPGGIETKARLLQLEAEYVDR